MFRSQARPRPTGNFELYSWFFMRISAVVLILLLAYHLFYMHVILGVDNVDFALVAFRWRSPFWRIYDFVMLVFGWLHCTNGVRIVLDDYVRSQGGRVLAKTLLYLFAVVVLVLGSYVVLTFKP